MEPQNDIQIISRIRKESDSDEKEVQWSVQKTSLYNSNKEGSSFADTLDKPQNSMDRLKVNNEKNNNINIMNQFQKPNSKKEDIVSSLAKIKIRENSKGNNNRTKDLAFNYFFGDNPENSNKNNVIFQSKGQDKFQQGQFFQQGKNNLTKKRNNEPNLNLPQNIFQESLGLNNKEFSQNFLNDNFNIPVTPKTSNKPDGGKINQMRDNSKFSEDNKLNPQEYILKLKKFDKMGSVNMGIEGNKEDDNKLYKLNFPKSSNIPGKFYVIKSVDESNIMRSINFKIWCSTIKGNQKLQKAFKEADKKYPIYLFYSVNGSGKFMGLATMGSEVEYRVNFNYWSENDKWKGFFFVNWLIIKDIPNRVFRSIINEYNDNKPVTSSRDTQEIYPTAGMEMLKIFKEYPSEGSILEQLQMDEKLIEAGNFTGQGNFNGNYNPQANNIKDMLMKQLIQKKLQMQMKERAMANQSNGMFMNMYNKMNQIGPMNIMNPMIIENMNMSNLKMGNRGNLMNMRMNIGINQNFKLNISNMNLPINMNMNMYQKNEEMASQIPMMIQQLQNQQYQQKRNQQEKMLEHQNQSHSQISRYFNLKEEKNFGVKEREDENDEEGEIENIFNQTQNFMQQREVE